MPKLLSRFLLGAAAMAFVGVAGIARAQAPAQGLGGGASGGSNPLTNPYMNPYINPYLNPAYTGGTMTRNDALLFLWSAQQQPGGLLAPGYQGRARATGS